MKFISNYGSSIAIGVTGQKEAQQFDNLCHNQAPTRHIWHKYAFDGVWVFSGVRDLRRLLVRNWAGRHYVSRETNESEYRVARRAVKTAHEELSSFKKLDFMKDFNQNGLVEYSMGTI